MHEQNLRCIYCQEYTQAAILDCSFRVKRCACLRFDAAADMLRQWQHEGIILGVVLHLCKYVSRVIVESVTEDMRSAARISQQRCQVSWSPFCKSLQMSTLRPSHS